LESDGDPATKGNIWVGGTNPWRAPEVGYRSSFAYPINH
jgi:hypothetical protein